jgi:uncharacterized protein
MATRLNQSGLLFVPQRWQRAEVLRWLKRIHAWTGFWGALLFFMMGSSGFLLNHRSILKIDTGKPVEVSAMEVAVRPGQFADADALGTWAKTRLDLRVDGKPPQAKPEGEKRFRGAALPQAEVWTRVFTLPDAKVTVAYVPGAPNVSVKTEAVGLLATMKNLHKGTGLNVAWVLFLDTIAGALITMSLTGFLLWTRLHGSRLLAGAIGGGALVWAIAATAPFFA